MVGNVANLFQKKRFFEIWRFAMSGNDSTYDFEHFCGSRQFRLNSAFDYLVTNILDTCKFSSHFPPDFSAQHEDKLIEENKKISKILYDNIIDEIKKLFVDNQVKQKLNFLDLYTETEDGTPIFSSTEEESRIREQLKKTEKKYRSKLKKQLKNDISKLHEKQEGLRKHLHDQRNQLKSILEVIEKSSQHLTSAYQMSDEWFATYAEKADAITSLKSHVPEASSQMELSDRE